MTESKWRKPRWWGVSDDGAEIVCDLCFHNCHIRRGAKGICGARGYAGNGFTSPHLGKFVSVAVDPIEKKPLHRWRPGTYILSLGGLYCNMACPFCQNHSIAHPMGNMRERDITPEQLIELAVGSSVGAVAYTYNEPSLQAEYIFEASPMLRERGIATVMVTNGMFGGAVCEEAVLNVDAMNIDVKAFDKETYKKLGGALDTVMRNVRRLVDGGVHVELTTLVVPGVSDSEERFAKMTSLIAEVSSEIPLHISRYFPAYQYNAAPTDVKMIRRFRDVALDKLKYVYEGNV
ncbi:MAG: radical SAM protein [Synergistaceae bacterium]|nr:radical SAM protein [Synergistaceae bacterium]